MMPGVKNVVRYGQGNLTKILNNPREGTPFPAVKYLKKHWSIGPV